LKNKNKDLLKNKYYYILLFIFIIEIFDTEIIRKRRINKNLIDVRGDREITSRRIIKEIIGTISIIVINIKSRSKGSIQEKNKSKY
jgi:hypothetical protein